MNKEKRKYIFIFYRFARFDPAGNLERFNTENKEKTMNK